MLNALALADTSREITTQEVDNNLYVVVEFLDYLRWLADQDTGIRLRAGQVFELFYEGVRAGRVWSEICADLELPIREVWGAHDA